MSRITYLYDEAAQDVSRITGIPWAYLQVEAFSPRRPAINLMELDWWDRMRVTFAVVAVENLLGGACVLDIPDRAVADSLSYSEAI